MYLILSDYFPVTALREAGNQLQALTLGKSEQQVHILYRLSCGTLYQIIQRTHHNNASTMQNEEIRG